MKEERHWHNDVSAELKIISLILVEQNHFIDFYELRC
jgi:hypothetical protein